MYDKKGVKIKRGGHVRYEGEIYRVCWAHFGKIVITDGQKTTTLRAQLASIKDRIVNIEVVGLKEAEHARTYAL